MASKKGVDIAFSIVDDEAVKALKNIQGQVSVMNKELNLTNTVLKGNSNNISEYENKLTTLNRQQTSLSEKVKIANEMFEHSKTVYGENSSQAQKWQKTLLDNQTALVKVENEISSTTTKMNELGKETDDLGTEMDNTSKKTSIFGDVLKANLISEAIIGGIKAIGNAMKEVGSAIIDIGKQAVSSYADYEQLIGGVETLFGESADIVQNYANNAYKTAGLSANQYMETVTSFSASLLQSLNGDTAKSAEVADMAITDMADNANKMGTSMESIQNAYQGFAKQNYTMLDNLKLGYGGTKTEMERLLSDATKLSGVEYDISNLNEVYEAIHVVQTELGITGTTAKEASKTISGSVSAMKSSWKNLLTGLATGGSDVKGMVNNVVESVLTVADNILPVVEQVADSILEVLPILLNNIIENLPKFLESGSKILSSIITGLQSNMSSIMTAVMQIINMLIKTIIENLPMILEMGIQLLVSLVLGIAEALPELIPTIIEAILLIIDTLLNNIDLIIDTGIELILGLIDGIINALPIWIEKAPIIIIKLVEAVIKALPKLFELGGKILGKIWDAITDSMSKMLDIGKNIVEGIWNGISNGYEWIKDKIKGWVGNVVKFIKNLFGIHSPSTLMRDQVGLNVGLGVAEGIEDSVSSVQSAMSDLTDATMSTISPTITPTITEATMGATQLGETKPVYITIEEFVNQRDEDIEELASELAYYIRQKEAFG